MRTIVSFLAIILAISITAGITESRETTREQDAPVRDIPDAVYLELLDTGMRPHYTSTAVDTYLIVSYDFEPIDWQGWTRFDRTAQKGTFFHADDFDGLGGGDFGRLVPLEGTKSIWCGARPDDEPYEYFCTWQNAPGYGNYWNQILYFGHVSLSDQPVTISYNISVDTEAEWDSVAVEYMVGYDEWEVLESYSGVEQTFASHEIHGTKAHTKLRFKFFSDGAWSDEDGIINTDGACIIDEITVSDGSGVIDYEDFEAWDVGADSYSGSIWHAEPEMSYGLYSGLANNLVEKDPCYDNFGTQIVFFIGSSTISDEYPGLYETPFCHGWPYGEGPCQDEMVVSPIIDVTRYTTGRDEIQDADIPSEDLAWLGGALLRYTVYRDLPLSNLVLYNWMVRSLDPVTLCPGEWKDRHGSGYYGADQKYIFSQHEIGDLLNGQNPMQIALVCKDWCEYWYSSLGSCDEHTPSPWFDNVELTRYSKRGPYWSYRALDLFQDNFPEDEFNLESWVRADAANDINSDYDPINHPGDSIVVNCTSPLAGGLRVGGVAGDEEVYCRVRVTDIGPAGRPQLFGPSLVGTYGTYASDDGEWTVIQCPQSMIGGNPVNDRYMVDLNDSLLTRGYMVEYYFEAYDLNNDRSTLPEHADEGQYFEFTCLPTGNSDILYVDDFDGIGTFEGVAELYNNWTFNAVIPPEDWPDRYDVNSPTSLVGNGLTSRAKLEHIKWNEGDGTGYKIILWDSGDLDVGTIGDGSEASDKGDDCSLLASWLDQSENDVGLWVAGDNIAYDMDDLSSAPSITLMSTWCGVSLGNDSYFELTGGWEGSGDVNPLITGAVAGIYGTGLEFYLFGGCPILNGFDILNETANGVVALRYPDYESDQYAAGIQSTQTNSAGYDARTLWLGFSLMSVRDAELDAPLAREQLLAGFMSWNGHALKDPWDIGPMEDETPNAYRLSQNFPNPFNPTTTIRFDIRAKGHVKLRIYNVAGQLVKTMVNDVMDAGSYTKEWKGTNNLGTEVASGVYFYRIEAGEYENVKKMVLLR